MNVIMLKVQYFASSFIFSLFFVIKLLSKFNCNQYLQQVSKMKNQHDFEGTFKWKFLIPIIYIASWTCMIFGPLYFSFGYQIFCLIVIGYSLIKTFGIGVSCIIALVKLKKIIKKQQKKAAENPTQININSIHQNIFHCIIIPSYKQDENLLKETLVRLAIHPKTTENFLVFLAMEDHEENCQNKAQRLIEQMKNNFRFMGFTKHIVRKQEAKGKASNVSWCAEHLLQNLQGLMIPKQQLFLTIMDADSWAPKEYFDRIQEQLHKNPKIFKRSIFGPPQIFTRNHLQVPVFNRIYDTMYSLVHLSNLVSFYFAFPLSNYSLSYELVQQIGFWDTNADAIAEDFHTCQKCFWKIKGRIYTIPIYTPFNQLSLSTGQGYCSDIKARFLQLLRHTRGVTDVAYSCNMLFKQKFQFRNIILTSLVLQVYLIVAIIPWAILSLGIQYKLIQDQNLHHFPMWIIDVVLNLTPALTILSYVFYEWNRRLANKQLFKQKNDPLWRVIEYPIIFFVALFGYSVPGFIISSFGVLCTKTKYRVSQKRMQKDNKQKSIIINENKISKEEENPENKQQAPSNVKSIKIQSIQSQKKLQQQANYQESTKIPSLQSLPRDNILSKKNSLLKGNAQKQKEQIKIQNQAEDNQYSDRRIISMPPKNNNLAK